MTDREKLEMVRAVLDDWIAKASWPLDDQLRSLSAKLGDEQSVAAPPGKSVGTRNFISRESVLELLNAYPCPVGLWEAIKALPSFPAPNPYEEGGRNVMGQTEDEFWNAVERVETDGYHNAGEGVEQTQAEITEQDARVRAATDK